MIIVFGDAPESFKELKERSGAKRRVTTIKPSRRRTIGESHEIRIKKKSTPKCTFFGADYGARTRHLHLGKVALYQMS